MRLARVVNGYFLSPLQALPRERKIQPMQTISIGTHVNVGFAKQIDLMVQRRYMRLDMTNKQQYSFLWHGQKAIKELWAKTVQIITLKSVANANRKR
jgi:hypothetical protein